MVFQRMKNSLKKQGLPEKQARQVAAAAVNGERMVARPLERAKSLYGMELTAIDLAKIVWLVNLGQSTKVQDIRWGAEKHRVDYKGQPFTAIIHHNWVRTFYRKYEYAKAVYEKQRQADQQKVQIANVPESLLREAEYLEQWMATHYPITDAMRGTKK